MNRNVIRALAASTALVLCGAAAHAGANLVTNGDFETNGGVGQVGAKTTLTGWSVTANSWTFVADSNFDSTGVPASFSPPNLKIWGANSGSNNGFSGSSNGGDFVAGDGSSSVGTLSQTIGGLTIGSQYDLTFEWSAGQLTFDTGATTSKWNVNFGGDSVSTSSTNVASKGFSGWMTFDQTFTATSASELLSFTPNGSPALDPILMIDAVSLTANTPPVPEPATWAMLLVGFAGLGYAGRSARRRRAVSV